MSTTGMVRYEDVPTELMQWREPELVLAEATKAAQALGRVIATKKNPVIFNNEQYLELEDWQTVAKFYGITAKVTGTRYVEYGGVTGWEAEAVALRADGMEVSRAESMCMTDEENWGMVPKYEWQDELTPEGKKIWVEAKGDKKGYYKGKRVKVGEVPKPLFQLRSMAQTRACAKALRQVLSWVVVLGGFKPNVAEEMIEAQLGPAQQEKKEEKPAVKMPQRTTVEATQKDSKPAVQPPAVQTVAGIIEKAKFGKKETLWITIPNEHVLMAEKEFVREDMMEGYFLSVEAKLAKSDKIGEYWVVTKVIKCEPVVEEVHDGEYVEDESESAEDTPQQAAPAVAPAAVEGLMNDIFGKGSVKKAAELPKQESKSGKPDIIGPKRAQHLHILISQNHKTTGFTEDQLTKMLHTPPFNLDHLRDLPYHLYEVVEKYATGENEDWKEG